MPGLPRKSTVKQFKKLMKKSGKAKTNKAAGATDPSSRKIATYEQYWLMKEMSNDIDPYSEEIWIDKDLELETKKLHAWLVDKVKKWDDDYELIYAVDDGLYTIELLKKDDDILDQDENFYFSVTLNAEGANLYSIYLKPDEDENDWETREYKKYGMDVDSEIDKNIMLKKLKLVIKNADYYWSEQ